MTSTTAKTGARRPAMDPRFAQRWIEARREEGRRRLRVLVVVGAIAAVALIAAGLLYSPAFELRHLQATETAVTGGSPEAMSGPSPPAGSQLASIAGVGRHPLMINIDASAAEQRLDADPWLADAQVSRSWPDSVRISVRSRTPVAVVAIGPRGAPTGYALIDPTGRVLGISASAPSGLPLLSIDGPVPAAGRWLIGSAGAAADPARPAGQLADMDAAASADDVPAPATAALVILDYLPAAMRAEVTAVSTMPALTLTVVAPATRGAAVQFGFGDGSLLEAKTSAFETLISQADLSGVTAVDLSVPSRPEATQSSGSAGSAG